IKNEKIKELENLVFELIDVREEEGGTLADQYGGSNKEMNKRVRIVHEKIDDTVEKLYSQVAFSSDKSRFDALINLYNKNQKIKE
ncbi:TPA: hypothetical protein U1218_000927, partial [Streptococcus suis]|nr:hypothetical protein [Streptococcus suis]